MLSSAITCSAATVAAKVEEHMSVEIYICDLKPEVQEQVLSELNLSSAKEGNYDLFPLFVVEKQE